MNGFRSFVDRFVSPQTQTAVALLLPFEFDWSRNMERLDEKISEVHERRDALLAERNALLPAMLVDETADKKIEKLDRQLGDVDRQLSRLGEARGLSAKKIAEEQAAERAAIESGEVSALQEAWVDLSGAVGDLQDAETSPDLVSKREAVATKLKSFHDLCASSATWKGRRAAIEAEVILWQKLAAEGQNALKEAAAILGRFHDAGKQIKAISHGVWNEEVGKADGAVPYIASELLSVSKLPFKRHPLYSTCVERATNILAHMPDAEYITHKLGPSDA